MKLILAQKDGANTTSITEKEILKLVEDKEKSYFYFDEKTKHKDILKVKDFLENKDYSVYLREAQFDIEDHYTYEMHVI